jgi:hypothetical protein
MIDQRPHDHRGAGHLVCIVAFLGHGLVPDCAVASGFFVLALGNKKGPEEAPCAPPGFRMALAIPGGAPGYDNDKEFGNNVTHWSAYFPKDYANHSGQTPDVKGWRQVGVILSA